MRNIETEQAIIGLLVYDEQSRRYIPQLDEADFTDEQLRTVFCIIRQKYDAKEQIDLITVSEGIGAKELQSLLFSTDMALLTNTIEGHIKNLKDATRKRAMVKTFQAAYEALGDVTKDIDDVRLNVMQQLSGLAPEAKQVDESLPAILLDTLNTLQERAANVGKEKNFTGLSDFDRLTGGLMKGELTILAARPGVGKTALALQIALIYAQNGNVVEFISREMSREQLGIRIYAHSAPIDGRILRKGTLTENEWGGVQKTLKELSRLPLYINNTAKTPQEIREKCRERKESQGLDLLIVDYLQLLKCNGKFTSREREIAEISMAVKEMSLEFNIPVLCLSQLNREGDGREPALRDLRESGAIEQDADCVVFLHKPTKRELNGQAAIDAEDCERAGNVYVRCILAKMRQSETGMFPLVYIPKHLRFSCLMGESKYTAAQEKAQGEKNQTRMYWEQAQ